MTFVSFLFSKDLIKAVLKLRGPDHINIIITILLIQDTNSLKFLSIKGLYNAMGHENRDNNSPQYTDHCFTGEYPTELVDRDSGNLSTQLSLLKNN